MNQKHSPTSVSTMRFFATLAIFFVIACAHCRTLEQGKIGYIVPGGKFNGTARTYTECGSFSTYFYLLSDHMIAKTLDRAEKERLTSKPQQPDGFLWSVDINPVGPSCYTLSVYGEN